MDNMDIMDIPHIMDILHNMLTPCIMDGILGTLTTKWWSSYLLIAGDIITAGKKTGNLLTSALSRADVESYNFMISNL